MGEACLLSAANKTNQFTIVGHRAGMPEPGRWYALKVRCGGEQKAVQSLRQRGLDPYWPTYKARRHYSDRTKTIDAPIFPGYVFCRFDLEKKLPVISSPGVDYIVGFAGVPTALDDYEMLNIQRIISAGAAASPFLVRGQRVRVVCGPFEGVEGILVKDQTGDRLIVSVQLLGQSAALHIHPDTVCAFEDQVN